VFTEINVEGSKIYKKPGIKDKPIKQTYSDRVNIVQKNFLNPCNIKALAKIMRNKG